MSAAARVAPPELPNRETEHLNALSILTLAPPRAAEAVSYISALNELERAALLSLADSHHVTVRALGAFLCAAGERHPLAHWAADIVAGERQRIANALEHLNHLCNELESHGVPVVIIKSLDHTPDLGNDLDLYTTAPPPAVLKVMRTHVHAELEARSWGDRLAGKWNFRVPGLRESVEIHVQRLGQTGEHTGVARRFVSRRVERAVGGHKFLVPAPEERVIVATLQRMYRHFYFRICDMLNTAALVDENSIDYRELERAARFGGIWRGVASYLKISSDYVARYRGTPLALPQEVLHAAMFGGEKLNVRARFIRVPMMPEGAALYTHQVTSTALRGDVPATFRLSLLPPLASAAAIAYKITGSDKGIW